LSEFEIRGLDTEEELLDALIGRAVGERPIVFVVGSWLTAPELDGPGVPAVAGMLDLVRQRLRQAPAWRPGPDAYQQAFQQLARQEGPEAVGEVVRRAVLGARTEAPIGVPGKSECERLASSPEGWHLNRAVASLGHIITSFPGQFGRLVLTSNFDPLIELGIRSAGGRWVRSELPDDQSLENTVGEGCRVVHFHGFWTGSDTLHTVEGLTHDRPRLRASFRHVLENSVVVVIAYGGWDDIFTRAIADSVVGGVDVMWTFHERNAGRVRERSRRVLNLLTPALNVTRAILYGGIDVRTFFPKLLDRLGSLPSLRLPPPVPSTEPEPDEGLVRRSELPRVLLHAADSPSPRTLGYDLELAIALDRSAYMALLIGMETRPLLEALLRAEIALRDAQTRPRLGVPVRWWFELTTALPSPPGSVEDVWKAVLTQRSPRLEALRQASGRIDGVVPAFVLEGTLAADGARLTAKTREWCGALRVLWPDLPLGIAVALPRPRVAAAVIAEQVARWPSASPVRREVFQVAEAYVSPNRPNRAAGARLTWADPELQQYLGASSSASGPGTDAWFKAKLEAQPDATADILRYVVELGETADLWAVLRAGGRSENATVARASLVFAAAADPRIDAWLDGADLTDEAAIASLCSVADSDHGGLADDVALGLMRAAGAPAPREGVESVLEALAPFVSPEIRAVDAVRRGARGADEFLESASARECGLALRAGIELEPSAALLQRTSLEHVDFWRFLTARGLSRDRWNEIGGLDPAQRAVFGLCTAAEWRRIAADGVLRQLVLDARRDRDLTFEHGDSHAG